MAERSPWFASRLDLRAHIADHLRDLEPHATLDDLADAVWPLLEEARKIAVEADAFISHMLYRGSWPGERYDVERLIGRLRATAPSRPNPGAAK